MPEQQEPVQLRGQLTPRITAASFDLLEYSIGTEELRLMAYLSFVFLNEQYIPSRKISLREHEILGQWIDKGWITGSPRSRILPTKEFWNAMTEILYLAYVDITQE